jgi:hypothetical protein
MAQRLPASSDLDDRLQEDRFVIAERRRLDDRAVSRLILRRCGLEGDGVTVVATDAPQGSATPYQDADRKLLRIPAKLHLPVGKAKSQDRCLGSALVLPHKDFNVPRAPDGNDVQLVAT